MFSQYTWGDFFKTVIPIIVLYYAWVAWTYYREDIREWISNRGGSEAEPVAGEEVEEPETTPSFLVTNDYREAAQTTTSDLVDDQQPEEEIHPLTSAVTTSRVQTAPLQQEADQPEVIMRGPAMSEQPEDALALSMMGLPSQNPLELPLDHVLETAQRLTTDPAGLAVARDEEDEPAVALATVINNQKARDAFADMTFTR